MNKPFYKNHKQQNTKKKIISKKLLSILVSTSVIMAITLPVYAQSIPKLTSLQDNKKLTLTVPKIHHFTTKNGVPVRFVYNKSLPIVDVSIRFRAGSAYDEQIQKGKYGIANMVATMLTQGTKTLDEDEYNRQVEQLGIWLNASAGKDSLSISLRSLSDSEQLQPAVELLSQVLSAPRFDNETLQRNQARLLVSLKRQQEDPSRIASNRFYKELYGNHPYANPTIGDQHSLPTITSDNLVKFHQQYLVANNGSMAITGNVTLADAKKLADKITRQLPKGIPAKTLATPTPIQAKRVHIPFDSSQTVVIMGQLGHKRSNDPIQWQKNTHFNIANHILAGGSFNARLMKEVRKKRGLTYGIYGSMNPMLSGGDYRIRFSTRNDKLDEALTATIDTIKYAQQQGLTKQEISITKDELANSFPMTFDSNKGINGLLDMMAFYQLPDSYLANYLQRIQQSEDVLINQSLQQTLNPEEWLIITVGNASNE